MASINKSKLAQNLGFLGEELVAQWLQEQGFQILARRWRCGYGEIDIIALQNSDRPQNFSKLAFVEVKTRSKFNWDAGGLLAISSAKQAKIRQGAALFIAEHPDLADCACQFDVALVTYHPQYRVYLANPSSSSDSRLRLQEYLEAAFE